MEPSQRVNLACVLFRMKPETRTSINTSLTNAAKQLDAAVPMLCEAVCAAVNERQFVYAHNLLEKTQAVESALSGCLAAVLPEKAAVPPEKEAKTSTNAK